MTILELSHSRFILRDDLDAEDLMCLLDLLRDVRTEFDGRLIDVSVGYAQPRPEKQEEPRS